MCGIAGFIHKNACSQTCQKIENISHQNQACRGPDSHNSWSQSTDEYTVHLYHQRLRIQDLSPTADQPMHSRSKKDLHVVFNGEIYNSNEIKDTLIPNQVLNTRSDTEVLVESISINGSMNTLGVARGMFAIGSYDSENHTLELMRDYFGEKPMHYTFGNEYVLFASQFDTIAEALKSIGETLELDQVSIYKYLIMGYFPFGSSLYKNILKQSPGSLIKFDLNAKEGFFPKTSRWIPKWTGQEPVNRKPATLENLLTETISEQLIGDVPIGVFLSGGVDSTLVSALAQKQNSSPIHSFSLGFVESEFDESNYALQAAKELGTFHHALEMSDADAACILTDVLRAYPEPLGDPSVFPTTYISREARKHVTVVLTGDGADELFFGYGRYSRFLELQAFKDNYGFSSRMIQKITSLALRGNSKTHSRLRRLNQAFMGTTDLDTYLSLVAFGHIKSAANMDLFNDTLSILKKELANSEQILDPYIDLREIDVCSYLSDNILVKVDRAGMAFGLETRAPFLDKRVANLSASASHYWLNGSEQKQVLREILSGYVSQEVFMRPKMGFGAPIGEWFRTTLNPWGSKLVERFEWENVGVNSTFVHNLWEQNLKSKDTSATYLWILLSLASSVERFS